MVADNERCPKCSLQEISDKNKMYDVTDKDIVFVPR